MERKRGRVDRKIAVILRRDAGIAKFSANSVACSDYTTPPFLYFNRTSMSWAVCDLSHENLGGSGLCHHSMPFSTLVSPLLRYVQNLNQSAPAVVGCPFCRPAAPTSRLFPIPTPRKPPSRPLPRPISAASPIPKKELHSRFHPSFSTRTRHRTGDRGRMRGTGGGGGAGPFRRKA